MREREREREKCTKKVQGRCRKRGTERERKETRRKPKKALKQKKKKNVHFAGEDAAEREEPPLVLRRDHLGNVEHQRAVGVARADGLRVDVVERALVERLDAVDLRRRGRGQVVDHHLEEGLVGREPCLHDPVVALLLLLLLLSCYFLQVGIVRGFRGGWGVSIFLKKGRKPEIYGGKKNEGNRRGKNSSLSLSRTSSSAACRPARGPPT